MMSFDPAEPMDMADDFPIKPIAIKVCVSCSPRSLCTYVVVLSTSFSTLSLSPLPR